MREPRSSPPTDPKARLALLKSMPIFGGVSEEVLAFIVERSPGVEVPEGAFFFHEGDIGNVTYVLERGRVAILRDWEGDRVSLRKLDTGDCFGEMALLDLLPRSASVQAIEDCSAIELSPRCLLEVSQRSLEQYAMIYMNVARELSRRLRRADDRLFRAMMQAEILDEESIFSPI